MVERLSLPDTYYARSADAAAQYAGRCRFIFYFWASSASACLRIDDKPTRM